MGTEELRLVNRLASQQQPTPATNLPHRHPVTLSLALAQTKPMRGHGLKWEVEVRSEGWMASYLQSILSLEP